MSPEADVYYFIPYKMGTEYLTSNPHKLADEKDNPVSKINNADYYKAVLICSHAARSA